MLAEPVTLEIMLAYLAQAYYSPSYISCVPSSLLQPQWHNAIRSLTDQMIFSSDGLQVKEGVYVNVTEPAKVV